MCLIEEVVPLFNFSLCTLLKDEDTLNTVDALLNRFGELDYLRLKLLA